MTPEKPNYPVSIFTKNMDQTESIRTYIETKLAHISLQYPRPVCAEVVVEKEKHHEFRVSVRLICTDAITIQAETEAPDFHEGVDRTVEKVERQMRKAKTSRLKRLGH